MDVIKKNMWSIVCGVVAVLAVVSTFYPLNGKFDELNQKLQSSVADKKKLKQLNDLNPNMPVIDPKTSEVKKLNQFPTEKIIAKGREVVGKVHSESEKLQARALAMNERKPLVASALPKGGLTALSAFKEAYYAGLEQMKLDLDATTVPTTEDVKKREDEIFKEQFEPLIKKFGDQEQNRQEVDAAFADAKLQLPRDMKIERAKTHAMYIMGEKQGSVPGTTASFDYHPGIPSLEDNRPPDVHDVWAAQLGYWIQQDVVNAIKETNASVTPKDGKLTVEDAIIKRLNKTEIPKVYMTRTGPIAIDLAKNPQNVSSAQGQPAAADDNAAGAIRSYGFSATGRVCNPSYDVMHFTVQVDADAQKFQTFMANLTRGKFITILRVDVQGVDRQRIEQNAGYIYGKQPVVRLWLKCETIFFRSLTVDKDHPLMPVNVQKLLKIPQTPGAMAELR
jgi:hypothetical protein